MLNGMVINLSMIGSEAIDTLLRPMAASFGDMFFYALISDFIRSEINNFGFNLLSRVSSLVSIAALTIVTIWIIFQGFRIISGQSRDSMMAFVLNVARVSLIVVAATSVGVLSGDLHKFMTKDLPDSITATVTGVSTATAAEQIDGNLAAMQFAMSSIDAINIVQDPTLDNEKRRALTMVAIGTAGPAMIGGAMLLLYQVALALFVGLGPLFILCLLFDNTKSLFNKWLMNGISTMFSLAVLSAMLAISTKLVVGVAGAFWTTTTLSALTGLSLSDGMTTIALQQGGVGLLLTVLIVSTPPMAANFFGGTVGGFSAQTLLGNSSAAQNPNSMKSGSGIVNPNYNAGRHDANPGESGYQTPAPGSVSGNSAYRGGNVSQSSQSPQSSYNNPATNPNYGTSSSQQQQGLRGEASPNSSNASVTPKNINNPQTSRDDG